MYFFTYLCEMNFLISMRTVSVTDAKKMWGDLTMDLMRHLELPEPRPKWKFEDEMGFFVPYLIQQR